MCLPTSLYFWAAKAFLTSDERNNTWREGDSKGLKLVHASFTKKQAKGKGNDKSNVKGKGRGKGKGKDKGKGKGRFATKFAQKTKN